jgi:hypothetical protein
MPAATCRVRQAFARNQRGIEPVADFGFPDFRRDHPFAIRPASLAPARPIVDRPRIDIVQSLKSAFAILLDKEPHLFDGLPDLGRFRAASSFNPLRQSPGRRCPRLALLPRCDAQRRRQLARRRDKSEPLRCPVDLAIGTRAGRRFDEVANHFPDCLANFVRALGNDPPHEFTASRAICRDRSLLGAGIQPTSRFAPIGFPAFLLVPRVRAMTGDDVLPPQIYVGADSGDVLTSLGIDGFIVERFNAKRLPKFIHTLPYVQRVARRAMEVGYLHAMRARREQPGPIAKDFDNLDRLAECRNGLNDLIQNLNPHSVKARDLALPILTGASWYSGRLATTASHSSQERRSGFFESAPHRAALEGNRIKERSACQERAPDHAAFLRTLAEAWIHLTGCKPGSNPDHSSNPFLRFSAIAWSDVFNPEKEHDQPEFTGALRQLPDWSEYQVSKLASKGPDWL